MKPISPPLQIAAGLGLLMVGFVYDVMFAGVPYQDPTPELSASFALHAGIAAWVRWIGLGIICVGAVGMMARRVGHHRKRRVKR